MPAGLLATTTDARGAVTQRAYTAAGDLARVTDPAGVVTEYTYDALGRETGRTVITDAHPGGVSTTTAYDGESRPVTATGPVTSNHITGEQHRARTTYTYDADGSLLTETVADTAGDDTARTTTYTYDNHGRPATLTDAAQRTEHYGYDAYGRQTSRTLPGDRAFRYTYTHHGHLAEVVLTDWTGHPDDPADPTDVVLDSYAYDPAGRLAEHTDAMGRTVRYTYYDDGLPAQEILAGFHDPDGSTRDLVLSEKRYDAAGHLTEETTGNGAVTTVHEVDAAGRLTAEVLDPDGLARRTAYTYDAADAVLTATRTGAGGDRTEQIRHQYNSAGALIRQTVENGAEDLVTTYDVDDRGLVVAETGPRGNTAGADPAAYTTDHTYDALGRLVESRAPPVTVETHGSGATTARPTTRTGYNTFGEVTDEHSPNGHLVRTAYDTLGRPVSTTLPDYTPPGGTSPLPATLTRTYDAAGNLATEQDALGRTTTYTYDQLGNLTKVTEPAPADGAPAPVSTFTYDLLGEQLSATGPTGARTEATYDDLGRKITATVIERHPAPGAFTTTYTYDDSGNLTSTTSPTGLTTATAYNPAGQPLSATDTAGKQTGYGYGPTGLTTAVTTPQGRTTRTAYDPAGRPTSVTDLDSAGTELRTRTSTYDAAGNPVAVTDALGHTTEQSFDALGRLTELVEPVDAGTSLTTTFGYDAEGHRTRLTDGRGHTTWYTFTSRGLPESTVEPATAAHPDAADRTWTTVYDAVGNPVKELQPGGVTQQRTFDRLGRITEVTGSGAEAATAADTFGYDLAGHPTSISAPGGTNTYTYDDRGNLLSANGPSGTATFGYDTEGRLTSRTDAAGAATFGYDSAGRLRTAADPLTQTTWTYGYDNASRPASVVYGASGAVREFAYDPLDRLTADILKGPGGTTTASVEYTYDAASRLVAKTTAGTAGAGQQSYGYDWAGRLTSWTAADGTVTAYGWDAAGNRTSAGGVTAVYDERNRLLSAGQVSYAYAARGTRTSVSGPDGTAVYAFDAHGRMVGGGGVAYAYDGLGRLVERGGEALTYADQSNNLVAGGGELVFRGPGGEALSSAAADGSGAAALLSDGHGDVTGSFAPSTGVLAGSTACSPFGRVTAWAGDAGVLGYQGEYTDPGSGQVNMHARWYDPAAGGFSSRDSWTLNPVPSIRANRYTYANASPLLHTDPSGHTAVPLPNPVLVGGLLLGAYALSTVDTSGWFSGWSWPSWSGSSPGSSSGSYSAPSSYPLAAEYSRAQAVLALQAAEAARIAALRARLRAAEEAARYRAAEWARTSALNNRLRGGSSNAYVWGGSGRGPGSSGAGSLPHILTPPPPPPPPPPWREILEALLKKAHPRPSAKAEVDSAHEQFVDESFNRPQQELAVSEEEIRGYFKQFPNASGEELLRELLATAPGTSPDDGNSTTTQDDPCAKPREERHHYQPLRNGRPDGATALLCPSDVKPTGSNRDDDAPVNVHGFPVENNHGPAGGSLYNRTHIIGDKFNGAWISENLFKGHDRMNKSGMRRCENKMLKQLKVNNPVFYSGQLIYENENDDLPVIQMAAYTRQGRLFGVTVKNISDWQVTC